MFFFERNARESIYICGLYSFGLDFLSKQLEIQDNFAEPVSKSHEGVQVLRTSLEGDACLLKFSRLSKNSKSRGWLT